MRLESALTVLAQPASFLLPCQAAFPPAFGYGPEGVQRAPVGNPLHHLPSPRSPGFSRTPCAKGLSVSPPSHGGRSIRLKLSLTRSALCGRHRRTQPCRRQEFRARPYPHAYCLPLQHLPLKRCRRGYLMTTAIVLSRPADSCFPSLAPAWRGMRGWRVRGIQFAASQNAAPQNNLGLTVNMQNCPAQIARPIDSGRRHVDTRSTQDSRFAGVRPFSRSALIGHIDSKHPVQTESGIYCGRRKQKPRTSRLESIATIYTPVDVKNGFSTRAGRGRLPPHHRSLRHARAPRR